MVSAVSNLKVFHNLFHASFHGPIIVAGSHLLRQPGLISSQYEQFTIYSGVYHMTFIFSFVCICTCVMLYEYVFVYIHICAGAHIHVCIRQRSTLCFFLNNFLS